MAEIFLSYQRKDRDVALQVVDALIKAGFSIWWDDDVDPREDWSREIEREHAAARTVLVLWTRNSIESEWVRAEALRAKDAKPRKLIQARFDDCDPPMAFTYVNYVDLTRARPASHANWPTLVRWLKAGEAQDPPPPDQRDREPEPPEQPVRLLTADRRASPAQKLVLVMFVVLVFLAVVGFGWFRLFSGVMSTPVAAIMALLVALLAVSIGRLIGKRIAGENRRRNLLLYPFLVMISSLGTFNSAFQVLGSGTVLQEEIDDAQRSLSSLNHAAQTALGTDAVDRRTARVEALLIQFAAETMNSPRLCSGLPGPAGRVILAEIDRLLPGFADAPVMADPSGTCDDAMLVTYVASYEGRARSMLQLNPDQRKRSRLRLVLAGQLARARARLAGAEMGLGRGILAGAGGHTDAQLALEYAARTYSDGYDSLTAVRPAAVSALPTALNIDRVRHLGSIAALPEILFSRIGYPSTWFYLLLALGLDLILIFLFAETSRRTLITPVETDGVEDLQFLWVDEER